MSRSAPNTTYAVMILVSDAGSTGWSGFIEASTWPEVTSISRKALAATSGAWGIWADAGNTEPASRKAESKKEEKRRNKIRSFRWGKQSLQRGQARR